MAKSRQKEEKRGTQKHFVDETEELFFCFTKKTKKSGVPTNANSQLRSSSIASNSGRKSSKKSLLSPRNIKMNKVTSPPNIKHEKSPHRKKFGDHNRYLWRIIFELWTWFLLLIHDNKMLHLIKSRKSELSWSIDSIKRYLN